jgi:prevent-host-death family protein
MAMRDVVSAADANRQFSELLRAVRSGRSVTITSHGKAVARLVPTTTDPRSARAAREALIARLRGQPVRRIGRWTRDELYEREA